VFAEAALNERDYGELSGLGRVTASARWGAGQVRRWRRSYAECPPGGESLRDTAARALAAFLHRILPRVMVSDTTLVVAHGNSLRALIMALEGMSPEAVMDLELKPGEARVYTLGPDTAVVSCDLLII
ncbi:MAG TPA: histidine phosphatase family protein, partial [Phenylobacterium sp.]|nr:histidine phosphatase family protein [Phenylobacterium sp.]